MAAALAALVLSAVSTVHAQETTEGEPDGPAAHDDSAAEEAFSIGSQSVWFVLAGVTGGATITFDGAGGYIGGELSLARLIERSLLGFYVDGFYEFTTEAPYLTAGPEIGLVFRDRVFPVTLGLDGGVALRFASADRDGFAIGGTARVFANFAGLITVYARYMHVGTDDRERLFLLGGSLKFPIAPPFGPGAP